jgi:LCP family protein required for cell wall assembly
VPGCTGSRASGASGAEGRSLRAAVLIAAATAVVPGLGHLLLGRRRIGALVLALLLALLLVGFETPRPALLRYVLSANLLLGASMCCAVGGLGWAVLIVHSYRLARPARLSLGLRLSGAGLVLVLCLLVVVPLGWAASVANAQRALLTTVFRGGEGGTAAAVAIQQSRLNVLLLGSDAGPDRTGTRTDTIMVASIDTHTARTVLFALPRNLQRVRFPPGSPMAARFPQGFADPAAPLSGDYLLNAIYPYGQQHPEVAPPGPTDDPGLNLLNSAVAYLLDLPLDYYVMVDMAGFASLVDAVGGLRVDVGPDPIPIGGVTASGQHVKPDGYLQPGVRLLDGQQALWFVRSRRDSSDYQRMNRQRCLLQAVLDQKNPTDLLTHFQRLASAATAHVRTNIPADLLPRLAVLTTHRSAELSSVSFDPSLADPQTEGGRFSTTDPDLHYIRYTVHAALAEQPAPSGTTRNAPEPAPLVNSCRAPTP